MLLVFFTARSFLPHLVEKNSNSEEQFGTCGKIAVISSIMGSQECAGSNALIYRASKAAATNLARSLAIELAPAALLLGRITPDGYEPIWAAPSANVSPQESCRTFDQI